MDHMPDWDHFKNLNDAEGEEWKDASKLESAKKLYNQARQVYKYAALFCETLSGEMASFSKELIMQNAMMLCPKIVGAEAGDLYIIRMENASIIRTNAKELAIQIRGASLFDHCKKDDMEIVLSEIEKFRALFITWVSYFQKDDFEDEWGLY